MSGIIKILVSPIPACNIGGGTIHTELHLFSIVAEGVISEAGDTLPLLSGFRTFIHGTNSFQCDITELVGFLYDQPDLEFGNTVDSEYGFQCPALLVGTNKFGFYAANFSAGGYPLYISRGTSAYAFLGPNTGIGGSDALVPAEPLVVVSQNATAITAQFRGDTGDKEIIEIASFDTSHIPTVRGWGSPGTFSSPSATQDDGILLRLAGSGTNNAGTPVQTGVVAAIELAAAQNFTTANQGTQILFRMCPANSTTLTTFVTMEAGLVTITGQTTPELRLDSSGDSGEYLNITRTSSDSVGLCQNYITVGGQGYSLAGSGAAGDFVELGTSFTSDTDGVSISLWIRPEELGTQRFWYVRGQDGSGNGWNLGIYHQSDDKLNFSIVNTAPAQKSAISTTTLSINTWYHVGAVWEPGTGLKLYLNGSLEATTADASTQLRSSGVGTRLFRDNGGGEGILGKMDALMVWKNVVIDGTEMTALAAGTDPSTTPDYQYKMNEGSGTTVTNTGSAGAGFNGTINNSITYSTTIPSQNPLPPSGSNTQITVWRSEDDDQPGIEGKVTVGHSGGRTLVTGGQIRKRTTTATSYTALLTDYIIGVTSTASARTITLPPAASAGEGFVLIIKDESGGAGTNNITIDGDGSENIDGATTKVISTNYGAVRLYCTGTAWFSY